MPEKILGDAYLYEAVIRKDIKRGDILEVDALGKVENLLYLGPDQLFQHRHHFLPEKPSKDMMEQIISNIKSWKKVGHITSDEWNAMVKKIKEEQTSEAMR